MQQALLDSLRARPRRWLLTGSAGFIGSNLLEVLLRNGQQVVSLDNFATGHRRNLDQVREAVGDRAWVNHRFIEGDIADPQACQQASEGAELVLHQAALGSVPRSINDPLGTHRANATGFLNMLVAAKDAGVERFVYAASSSTYGDSPTLPKVEDVIGRPLSPYAVTKYLNELYADVFGRCYGLATIGLRYFNVFGPRQDPSSPYSGVISLFIRALVEGRPPTIYGDGEQTRDFTYVANVVDGVLRACTAPDASGEVINVATGGRISLNELFRVLKTLTGATVEPTYGGTRAGDVRDSQADIGKARRLLGYEPSVALDRGLEQTVAWFRKTQMTTA